MPSGGGLRRISSTRFCISSGVICGGGPPPGRARRRWRPTGAARAAAGTAVDHHHRLRILVLHHQRQLGVLIDEQAQRAAGLFLGFENVGLALGRFGDAGIDPLRAGVGKQRRRQPLHLHAHAAHARFVHLLSASAARAAGALAGTRHHDAHAAAHAAAVLRVFPRRGAVQHHGALDRRTADHAAHRHLFEAMHLVGPRERDHHRAFHVASAHRAAERPLGGQGLEAGDLVFAAKRLARAGNDAAHAILQPPSARSRRSSN